MGRLLIIGTGGQGKVVLDCAKKFYDKLNLYYTQNVESENNLENQLDRAGGAFNRNHLDHFNALKAFVAELKGFALFDNDNKNHADIINDAIATVFWKEYEIENYFLSPEVMVKFIEGCYKDTEQELFMHGGMKIFMDALNEVLLSKVFGNSAEVLEQYHRGGKDLKRFMLRNIKMSEFAEEVFRRYAEKMKQPIPLTKGEFCRLVPLCAAEEIPKEVSEKLDMLVQYLEYSDV
jgi:hypothetical protein